MTTKRSGPATVEAARGTQADLRTKQLIAEVTEPLVRRIEALERELAALRTTREK